jgi:ketosteroid isomerase-like protein
MRARTCLLFAFSVFTIVAAWPVAAAKLTDDEALQAAKAWNEAYNKATGAKNGDAVAAMYIPDGVQVQSKGVATGRAAIRARYLDDWKTVTEQPASVEYAKAAEDGTILVVGNWHVVIQGAKGPEDLRGYYADILVQQDGTWLTKLEFDIDAKP